MEACEVRAAQGGDLGAVLALYSQLAADRVEAGPAEAEAGEDLFRSIISDPDRHLLVAVSDGDVVGTADMTVVSNLTHHGRPWAVVENVVVDEGWRSQGVGRALMDELVKLARGRSCYKVQLLSLKYRHDAHRFYQSIGFEALAEGFRIYLD
jgi:GNAT superfamily N-acetyltransferase